MELTFKISKARLRNAVAASVDEIIFYEYDDAIIRAAGVPKRSEIIKEILEDVTLKGKVQRYADHDDNLQERLTDALYEVIMDHPAIAKQQDACDNLGDEIVASIEKEKTKTMIEYLNNAGYTVIKS